jgi:hypothetical protein
MVFGKMDNDTIILAILFLSMFNAIILIYLFVTILNILKQLTKSVLDLIIPSDNSDKNKNENRERYYDRDV